MFGLIECFVSFCFPCNSKAKEMKQTGMLLGLYQLRCWLSIQVLTATTTKLNARLMNKLAPKRVNRQ